MSQTIFCHGIEVSTLEYLVSGAYVVVPISQGQTQHKICLVCHHERVFNDTKQRQGDNASRILA